MISIAQTTFLVLLAWTLSGIGNEAYAASFGQSEAINCIADVKLKGASGEDLCIAYKTTTTYFVGPVWITNDGYVLRIHANEKRYFNLPPPDKVAAFQAKSLLPAPLPPYQLSAVEYAEGFKLWLGLIGCAALLVLLLGAQTLFRTLRGVRQVADGMPIEGKQRVDTTKEARTKSAPLTTADFRVRRCYHCSGKMVATRYTQYKLNDLIPLGKRLQYQCTACTNKTSIRSLPNVILIALSCIAIPFFVPIALQQQIWWTVLILGGFTMAYYALIIDIVERSRNKAVSIDIGQLDRVAAVPANFVQTEFGNQSTVREASNAADTRFGNNDKAMATVTPRSEVANLCAECGVPIFIGVDLNIAGRPLTVCNVCAKQMTKPWWQFWKAAP